MRKWICLILLGILAFSLCACKEEEDTGTKDTTTASSKVDINLTSMNATMVYSTVYDMVQNPEVYEGKVVKMNGSFSVVYWEPTQQYYTSVLIADATACCSQGIEFVLKGNPEYPNSYPKKGENITVTGTFCTYYEGNQQYIHLVDSVLG